MTLFQTPPPLPPLAALWESTTAFFKEFGVTPTVASQFPVLLEEVKEVSQALLKPESNAALARELADVLVVLMTLAQARGITLGEFYLAIGDTARKNDAKTLTTHHVDPDTGKITKRR